MPLSIRSNVTLATLDRVLTRWGLLREGAERRVTEEHRRRLNIRMSDADGAVGKLSGAVGTLVHLDADTEAIMASISHLLPPEAREERTPTPEELARTYPGGKVKDTDETERRPGTD